MIKRLFFPTFYLALIAGAYLAGLSLTSGNLWIRKFRDDLQVLLLSTVVLSAIYIVLFLVFSLPGRKQKLRYFALYFLSGAGVLCLSYVIFFSKPVFIQKVGVSAVLFSWIAVALVFSQVERGLPLRILRYVLGAMLLAIISTSMYEHKEMLFYPQTLAADLSVEKRLDKRESMVYTALYRLSATEYFISDYYIPAKLANIPSYLGVIDDKNFLVIDRLGNMFHLDLRSAGQDTKEQDLYIRLLDARLPINYQEFHTVANEKHLNKSYFRVHDVYIEKESESGEQRSLYVSHHFWHAEKQCTTMRITRLEDISVLSRSSVPPAWRTLYESAPCLSSLSFGHQAGGRIVGLDEKSLLFTIGDHGFDARPGWENFPQDIDAAYGKIWKIDRRTGAAEMVSLGHRNPQGLYRAPDGTVWSTEHGPASGDELNKINAGANYGWPHVLYGAIQDGHEGYESPVFAWVPAIAVSNLIGVEGDLFPLWKDDLLISSLKAETLFRLQLHEDRVVYSEAIKIGTRIRDLSQTPNGEIFLWTDNRSLVRLHTRVPGSRKKRSLVVRGEQLFQEKCVACHGISPGLGHGVGPNLHDVYDSKIARYSDYSYSDALLTQSHSSWNRKNLDLFLQDPMRFAPGTIMQIKIPDDGDRQALMRYLKSN